MREDEIEDEVFAESVVQLTLTLAPHMALDASLRQAAEAQDSPLQVVTSILQYARIAELSSFGRIADDRIKVIGRVEQLKDDKTTLEALFQELIEQAPWLIDPQWSPLTTNQSFGTLKTEFQKFYKGKTGQDLVLEDFAHSTKRADFVLSSHDNVLQLIEIKRPFHSFDDTEMERMTRYVDVMEEFLGKDAHKDFRRVFNDFHVTLVCDEVALTGVHRRAFDSFIRSGRLTHIDWATFLLRTRRVHEEFLQEAQRQRLLAVDSGRS